VEEHLAVAALAADVDESAIEMGAGVGVEFSIALSPDDHRPRGEAAGIPHHLELASASRSLSQGHRADRHVTGVLEPHEPLAQISDEQIPHGIPKPVIDDDLAAHVHLVADDGGWPRSNAGGQGAAVIDSHGTVARTSDNEGLALDGAAGRIRIHIPRRCDSGDSRKGTRGQQDADSADSTEETRIFAHGFSPVVFA
jgi:hypothetical protein